jgi:hypothetical protein
MAAKTGDPCQRCRDGKLVVASSQRSGDYQTRYLRCTRCGNTDKHILAASEIRRVKTG